VATRILRDLRDALHDGGLRGSFLVRDLDTGDELGIDAESPLAVASLVKVPLALATLERAERGELDLATPIEVRSSSPGPTGLSRFRHPATVAVDDLLYLSLAISDNAATDELFAITPPAEVAAELRRLGYEGMTVRHPTGDLMQTPTERFAPEEKHLAQALAIAAATEGRGHPMAMLDISRANSGSARAFVDLLQGLWRPTTIRPAVAARVRELMGDNLIRQRLAPDFTSDASKWSSKTGTMLNLRHEVGVVEHADGQTFAVAALTESTVPAVAQPGAEALMAQVARSLRDAIRAGRG
jgi:beta-lactamase class A